ncbi:acyl-protein synthetase [Niveibacterium microcysteis]|uniref:Acyl-protein synthetase n=1 Tax=Niveibacterium microcysteis TaxID=2811415 RepID=A0ABX7M340_9RHOO|nr:acyl-protein synthetase [Niveibacterium microcysteis]QSI75301.1 acyl-protein synthetase [Niveibacterium microcysteis]
MADNEQPVGPFATRQSDKRGRLLGRLQALTLHHYTHCVPYARMLEGLHGNWRGASTLEAMPWLPVGLFKHLRLASVPDEEIIRELRSSGTSGSLPSRVLLDRETAAAQTKALARIVSDVLGRARRPMLVVDRIDLLRSGEALSARGAAVLGFGNFGRHHTYALAPDLALDLDAVKAFLARFSDEPVLVFGFTFFVWRDLVQALRARGERLAFPSGSVLLHGGGWKRLADQRVDNTQFKHAVADALGIQQVHNYYGMAEQVGSIFIECEAGRLHTPDYAEVIVRDPITLSPMPMGETGVIQLLSELPRSYPGHSLLTEDIGAVLGEDDCPCGRMGRTLRVDGRLPRAELRGCSDTRPA